MEVGVGSGREGAPSAFGGVGDRLFLAFLVVRSEFVLKSLYDETISQVWGSPKQLLWGRGGSRIEDIEDIEDRSPT